MVIFLLFIAAVSLYIGNYLYDYTLNPYAQKSLYEKMDINEDKNEKNKQWLYNHSEDVIIQSDDQLNLHGYFINQKSHIYVIMVHGYRADASSLISPIKKFKTQKYNLLIPDLRGHGQSEGDYIGMGWDDRQDIINWIDYILKIDKKASIILYGVSMGAATVMNVAGEDLPSQVKAIIEDCGYTSVWDVFKNHINMTDKQSEVALHLASFMTLLRAGYRLEDVNPLKQVEKCQIPILFIHGDKDEFVPYDMVYQLYNVANCQKQLLVISQAGHAESYDQNPKVYYQTVFRFIQKYEKKDA